MTHPSSRPDEKPFDPGDAIRELVEIMSRLRTPVTGCPWDLEQTFASIAPYTIEEAYEVADAISRNDMSDLREELGDLLLQVVFHSQMAQEAGAFCLTDVVHAISAKMRRRHPHIFSGQPARDAASQATAWEEMKAAERATRKAASPQPDSALDGVALALPALMRAGKLQKRAALAGFDWTDPADIFDKIAEETDEVRQAMASGEPSAIEEELGDLMFVTANLARRLGCDPEQVLVRANAKFERRFRAMEAAAARTGKVFSDLSPDAQEALWQSVKRTGAS